MRLTVYVVLLFLIPLGFCQPFYDNKIERFQTQDELRNYDSNRFVNETPGLLDYPCLWFNVFCEKEQWPKINGISFNEINNFSFIGGAGVQLTDLINGLRIDINEVLIDSNTLGLDGLYLRLNTSNDPLTNQLVIQGDLNLMPSSPGPAFDRGSKLRIVGPDYGVPDTNGRTDINHGGAQDETNFIHIYQAGLAPTQPAFRFISNGGGGSIWVDGNRFSRFGPDTSTVSLADTSFRLSSVIKAHNTTTQKVAIIGIAEWDRNTGNIAQSMIGVQGDCRPIAGTDKNMTKTSDPGSCVGLRGVFAHTSLGSVARAVGVSSSITSNSGAILTDPEAVYYQAEAFSNAKTVRTGTLIGFDFKSPSINIANSVDRLWIFNTPKLDSISNRPGDVRWANIGGSEPINFQAADTNNTWIKGVNLTLNLTADSNIDHNGVSRFRQSVFVDQNIRFNGALTYTRSNSCMGVSTLVGGTVTVNTGCAVGDYNVIVTNNGNAGGIGSLYVNTHATGSFAINSTNILDTSKVFWQIWREIG